jgi:hypothetical protein
MHSVPWRATGLVTCHLINYDCCRRVRNRLQGISIFQHPNCSKKYCKMYRDMNFFINDGQHFLFTKPAARYIMNVAMDFKGYACKYACVRRRTTSNRFSPSNNLFSGCAPWLMRKRAMYRPCTSSGVNSLSLCVLEKSHTLLLPIPKINYHSDAFHFTQWLPERKRQKQFSTHLLPNFSLLWGNRVCCPEAKRKGRATKQTRQTRQGQQFSICQPCFIYLPFSILHAATTTSAAKY